MDEDCTRCGLKLVQPDENGWTPFGTCDGIVYLGGDPYDEEILGDYTEHWMCDGQRHLSYMEI